MRISDWSSDVCSSDLQAVHVAALGADDGCRDIGDEKVDRPDRRPGDEFPQAVLARSHHHLSHCASGNSATTAKCTAAVIAMRSEEHTSELQSLMRISYAVFCLKKKNKHDRLLSL